MQARPTPGTLRTVTSTESLPDVPRTTCAPDSATLYETWSQLRDLGPIVEVENWDLLATARHDIVSRVLRDDRFGRDGTGFGQTDTHAHLTPTWNRYVRGSFMELDPPHHTRVRRHVAAAFSYRRVARLEPTIRSAATAAITAAGDSMDVVNDFATNIALSAISRLLDLPEHAHDAVVDWSHDIVRLFEPVADELVALRAEHATVEFVAMLQELIALRVANPGDDLVSALVQPSEGETLSEVEVIATVILLLNAGHEATVHAIANTLHVVVTDPEVRAALAERPIDDQIIAEFLRFDPPLQLFHRWALRSSDIEGVHIPVGTKLGLVFGGANRDPRQFARPDVIDLGRASNPHISFGAGVHRCIGAALARLEVRIALETFMAATSSRDLQVSRADRTDGIVFRGFSRLDIDLR